MRRRAWIIFGVANILGCLFTSFGSLESESVYVRFAAIAGTLLLLPGNIFSQALTDVTWSWSSHIRTFYLVVFLGVPLNAAVWLLIARTYRLVRRRVKLRF